MGINGVTRREHALDITDSEWRSIYKERPINGQICVTKIKGESGYAQCVFNNGYFETYNDQRNRLEITRWKHDLWLPIISEKI